MAKAYPHQGHIRFANEDEKSKAEAFAERNGLSLSAIGRLVFLRAIREGWEFDFKPRSKRSLLLKAKREAENPAPFADPQKDRAAE